MPKTSSTSEPKRVTAAFKAAEEKQPDQLWKHMPPDDWARMRVDELLLHCEVESAKFRYWSWELENFFNHKSGT